MNYKPRSELFERALRERYTTQYDKPLNLNPRKVETKRPQKIKVKSLNKMQWMDDKVWYNGSIEEALESAMETFKDDLIGKIFRTRDGRRVAFTKRGYKELFYSITAAMTGGTDAAANVYKQREDGDPEYLFDVLSVVASLPEVIRSMSFVERKENNKFSSNPEKQAVKYYDTYKCDVVINGDEQECFVRVEVPKNNKNPDGFYFHYLDESTTTLMIDGFELPRLTLIQFT